jgi:succinyl-diaminopimelate desuccinylase
MTDPFDPIPFLSELVAIPSSDPPGGELAVAEVVHRRLLALGLPSVLDEFRPGRANVVARLKGTGAAPPLVLSAHLDTVPVGDAPWDFDPHAGDVVDGRMRGRGAADMKGAVAAFVAAAAQTQAATAKGSPPAGDVILAFTAGESANCLGARRLVETGFQAEIGAFLCGEPSSLDLIVAEKAALWVEATAHGALGHVSGERGVNAIALMARFVDRLERLTLDLPDHPLLCAPTVSVGRIEGGAAVNLTPDRCRAEIDLRFGPAATVEDAMGQLQAAAPEGVTLRVLDFKPAIETPPDSPFAQICAQAAEARLGRKPAVKGVPYYSDGAILLDGHDAPFAIIGPGELGQSGQANETAPVANVLAAADIYAAIIARWNG